MLRRQFLSALACVPLLRPAPRKPLLKRYEYWQHTLRDGRVVCRMQASFTDGSRVNQLVECPTPEEFLFAYGKCAEPLTPAELLAHHRLVLSER